jgi:hypothetical protein
MKFLKEIVKFMAGTRLADSLAVAANPLHPDLSP